MQEEGTSSGSGSAHLFRATAAALLVVVVAIAAYAFHQRSVSKQLSDQNRSITTALNTDRDQIQALTAKLDAMTAERSADSSAVSHPPVYRKPMSAAGMRHRIEDPRWKKMQGQLDDQAKQIDATRQDLSSARTELQGSIATTHDQLVLLEKKGERSYFEFDVDKSGQFQREGPVGVRLHKANTKHEYADLELMVDDFKVSKKHVNIYEPVIFYSADSKLPIELVINSISKNHIHGYVSEPKFKNGDLEAMANSSANNTAGATNVAQPDSSAKPSPAVRQKLELPSRN
jgi:uncharacterized coiled-coil protein SlyX